MDKTPSATEGETLEFNTLKWLLISEVLMSLFNKEQKKMEK